MRRNSRADTWSARSREPAERRSRDRTRAGLVEPRRAEALPRPDDREERLVEREVVDAPVTRIDRVDVLRMEACVRAHEVRDDGTAVHRSGVRPRAMERVEVVERGAAGGDDEREEPQPLAARARADD